MPETYIPFEKSSACNDSEHEACVNGTGRASDWCDCMCHQVAEALEDIHKRRSGLGQDSPER